MNKFLVLLLLPFLFAVCKNKKTKLADDDTVEIADFIEFFPTIKLPFQLDDRILSGKQSDSASIGYRIFTQFVPDSILSKQFGNGVRPAIHPLGKVEIKRFETYLFLKASTDSKKAGYVLAFDKDNNFIAGLPLIVAGKDASTLQTGGMDTKYTVTKTAQKKSPDGHFTEVKNVFILNSEAREFSLIMTDDGSAAQQQDIINPIDTLPHRNKYSGDYIKDKRNYISIRDGKSPSLLLFFIHFEKDKGECTGELKGVATLRGTKNAIYRANGNPCVLEFTFSGNAVSVKEVEACGSYRDIKCFFDGYYAKRKEPRPKTAKKRK